MSSFSEAGVGEVGPVVGTPVVVDGVGSLTPVGVVDGAAGSSVVVDGVVGDGVVVPTEGVGVSATPPPAGVVVGGVEAGVSDNPDAGSLVLPGVEGDAGSLPDVVEDGVDGPVAPGDVGLPVAGSCLPPVLSCGSKSIHLPLGLRPIRA